MRLYFAVTSALGCTYLSWEVRTQGLATGSCHCNVEQPYPAWKNLGGNQQPFGPSPKRKTKQEEKRTLH